MALLGFLLELFPPRAFLHVVLALRDRPKDMADVVFAIDRHRVPRLRNVRVVVVKSGGLILLEVTDIFMLNELGDIAIVMARLVLALVHSLAFPVTTASDVELPFSILHELVVLVERAHKDFA